MTKRTILISILSLNDFKKTVKRNFARAKSRKTPNEPIHRLYFTDEKSLFGTLTPKRMELLRHLKKNGPLSNRQLAIQLERAYANVHEDVQQLLQLELIEKDESGKLIVPWDEIEIRVPLVA